MMNNDKIRKAAVVIMVIALAAGGAATAIGGCSKAQGAPREPTVSVHR